jgi:hypothetical protein
MIIRWISDVPSKIVKLVDVRAVSAGRWPVWAGDVSTNSAPTLPISDAMAPTCASELDRSDYRGATTR